MMKKKKRRNSVKGCGMCRPLEAGKRIAGKKKLFEN
jgi:hypothetical protein